MKRILVFMLCTSCSWGVGEMRGYVAARKEVSMNEVIAHVEVVEEELQCAPEETAEAIKPHLEAIRTRALDDIQIARVEQEDHGYQPKTPPVIDSEEDVRTLNAHAGKTHARTTRRRKIREIPARIIKGLASVVKNVIPQWVRWLLTLAVVVIVVSFVVNVVLYIRARFNRKAAEQMVVLAERHVPKDVLEGTRGTPAQKVFYSARRKGLLGVGEDRPHPTGKE